MCGIYRHEGVFIALVYYVYKPGVLIHRERYDEHLTLVARVSADRVYDGSGAVELLDDASVSARFSLF